MRVATWNVNSVKARLPGILAWLGAEAPDVVLFQELKCQSEAFPDFEFRALGYDGPVVGQKSYNGVALLSRHPVEEVLEALPGDESDEQARYVEGTVAGFRIASLYLPNGNPVTGPKSKFAYKLEWMERLRAHTETLLESEAPLVLGGDYNVVPTAFDVHDPEGTADNALCQPETRQAFRRLLNLGLTEAWRALHPGQRGYTYWDYGHAFDSDQGWRIDHFLLSAQAADRLESCEIDKSPRAKEKSSDHTVVVASFRNGDAA